MAETFSKIKKNLLIIAIAIVLVFFIAMGISTFYKAPKYEDYCNTYREKPMPYLRESLNCSEIIAPRSLEDECMQKKGYLQPEYDEKGCIKNYYCETCHIIFENVNRPYERNVFTIALILGIISIVIGIILKIESVSSGIMGGGILTLIYAVIRYWRELEDYSRFIVLGIVLIILIWFGYKKFKK